MATPKPYAATISKWLTENLGKGWSAPLTGQDWPALRAAVHVAELWSASDYEGRKHAAVAFAGVVNAMQPHCRWLAFHCVAHVADWGHRWQLWRQAGLDMEMLKGVRECKYGPRPAPKPAAPVHSDPAVAC